MSPFALRVWQEVKYMSQQVSASCLCSTSASLNGKIAFFSLANAYEEKKAPLPEGQVIKVSVKAVLSEAETKDELV